MSVSQTSTQSVSSRRTMKDIFGKDNGFQETEEISNERTESVVSENSLNSTSSKEDKCCSLHSESLLKRIDRDREKLPSFLSKLENNRLVALLVWQICFITSLTLIFAFGLSAYIELVDPFIPRSTGLTTPGLAIRPQPEDLHSTLITFRHGGSGNWQTLNSRFKEYLKAYSFGKRLGGSIVCNWKTQLTPKERCHIGNRKWMALDTDVPCTGAEKFGMYHGQPCVILKMNNVYGWEPEPYYNITEIDTLDMPVFLKGYIHKYWNKHCRGKGEEIEARCPQMRMVWLSCEGETAADTENMGYVHYGPWQGYPGYHYPYLNQQHFLSPLIFIQFRSITPGVIIQVRCKIWAKNIEHDPANPRKGGVHFEIMMD